VSSERSLADVDAPAPAESAASGAARADESARPAPILTVRGLTKTFYGVPAVEQVDFELLPGEVHGLLGENGAGKSTLCSVLAGLYRPDAGEICIDGVPVHPRSPHDAAALGIGMVYQHFRLVERFTVAENIVLGQRRGERRRAGVRSARHVARRVAELAEEYGLDVHPAAAVWQLSVGEQQRVEILKQLYRGARILVLDEPTAVLAPHEAERLFVAVREMVARGHAVVLVSHKLHEIIGHTDRVTVLRGGRNAGHGRTAELDPATLNAMVFGDRYASSAPIPAAPQPPGEVVLAVEDLSVAGDRGHTAVDRVSFEVRRGEIVGVAGVAGNGQRELHEAIGGLRPSRSGTVMLAGATYSRPGRRNGLAYVPEDRLGTGLAAGLPLDHNLALRSYARTPQSRGGVVRAGEVSRRAERLVADFDVRGGRRGLPVSLMSGGNLQKAILARELTEAHDVLMAAAPTRGLDLAAAATVRAHLQRARDERCGVLVFSEDLGELLEVADVVVVMFHGRIVGRFTRDEFDVARIGPLMTGGGTPVAAR
jgi:ABC-type uncharacterized transport system ATPase subunit